MSSLDLLMPCFVITMLRGSTEIHVQLTRGIRYSQQINIKLVAGTKPTVNIVKEESHSIFFVVRANPTSKRDCRCWL